MGKGEQFFHQALNFSSIVLAGGEVRHQIVKILWHLKQLGDKKEAWTQA